MAALRDLSAKHDLLLDIGCGPGKLCFALAPAFRHVIGIDRSPAMIEQARLRSHPDNVKLVCSSVEAAALPIGEVNLVTAGASIHWMDHAALFPLLKRCVATDYHIAIVEGDTPVDAPWQDDYRMFLEQWVPRLTGAPFDPSPDGVFLRRMNAFRQWLDIDQETTHVSRPFQQSIGDFIACQHSRDTFAPSRMGPQVAAFDRELRALLTPYASNDTLSYKISSTLTVGTIRAQS